MSLPVIFLVIAVIITGYNVCRAIRLYRKLRKELRKELKENAE